MLGPHNYEHNAFQSVTYCQMTMYDTSCKILHLQQTSLLQFIPSMCHVDFVQYDDGQNRVNHAATVEWLKPDPGNYYEQLKDSLVMTIVFLS